MNAEKLTKTPESLINLFPLPYKGFDEEEWWLALFVALQLLRQMKLDTGEKEAASLFPGQLCKIYHCGYVLGFTTCLVLIKRGKLDTESMTIDKNELK